MTSQPPRLSWLWRELFFMCGKLPKQPKRLMEWLDYLRDGDLYP